MGTVTPSDFNVETDVINLDSQDDDFIFEGAISLQNMESNDKVELRFYIAVDGVNQKLSDLMTFEGVQEVPVVRIPATTLHKDAKPRITIKQTAGSTLKAFPYFFIVQVMEVI